MLTVRQFLNLPPFREFKLVAGEKGLDNVISTVNIMDNPDALDWFSPGEMLLTSGYFFKDSREIQDSIVSQLRSINCPALCIKPRRYLGTIPQNMILLAEKLNLPVIELPYGIAFSKISSLVMEEISEKYDVLNKKSLDIHEEFFNISLQGGALPKICSSLSGMLENPVVLLDRYWNILHWTELPDDPFPLGEVLDLRVNEPFVSADFTRTLPPEFENLQKPVARQVDIEGSMVECVIMPVFISNVHYGFILVWKTFRDLTDIDYIALENGAMAFALERIRNAELERTKNRIRRDFFDELLTGKIQSNENLQYLCDLHGINPSLWYTPIVFNMDFSDQERDTDLIERKRSDDATIKSFLHFIDSYARDKDIILHSFSQNSQVIVLHGRKSGIVPVNTQEIKDLALELLASSKEEPDVNSSGIAINAGIGRTSKSLLDLSKSFIQAQEALRLARKASGPRCVCHYEDFVVHHFLEENVSVMEMRKFFENALGPLFDYDQKHGSELILTLETWISHHFNVAEAARALFTHRNTLLYRMERISKVLQSDLKDPEELLKFQLSLKIYRLLELGR